MGKNIQGPESLIIQHSYFNTGLCYILLRTISFSHINLTVRMKKTICFSTVLLIFLGVSVAQSKQGQIDSALLPALSPSHYQPEYEMDVSVDANAWTKEKVGMHAAFGSADQLYFRKDVPKIKNEAAAWETTGWRGERLNTQVLVWSTDTLEQVRFKVNDFKNNRGQVLAKDNVQLNMVRYVLSNYPYGAPDAVCGTTPYKNGYLMPDRFEPFERFDVPGKTIRPVWVSLNIPSGATPGTYNGTIEVISNNAHAVLSVKINVQNQTLPKPHDWKYRLDLWQNPWVIADYYHVKPWSDDHKALLKKHLKLYADAGGTFITTYGVHSPWGDNEYAIEGGMMEWIKHKDGTWKFDYSIFDQYVELAMSMGIDKAITIYTPLPWGERFRYLDEATGNYVTEQWLPNSDMYKNSWNAFLTNLKIHLEKKGWFNKTYLGINENEMSQTLAAIKVVKAHSSKWKITYAGNWHKELDTLLNDFSFLYGNEANKKEIKVRKARGQTTTYYICCNPAKPNTFLFSPPIEGRWLSWYAAAHNYDGLLRWAYDSWPADPMRDGRYGSWAAGDCYLVYPGGNSCIRFEKLREGIVDYEKIRIIKALAAKSTDAIIKKLANEFDMHLETLNMEKEFSEEKLKTDIERGKAMINTLSDLLIKK